MAVREVTDDNIKRRICIGWWITKAADTQSEYICFSTATMVTRTPLTLMLHARCYIESRVVKFTA